MFTQPLMYKKIAKQPTVLVKYAEHLINSGALAQQEYEVQACRVKIELKSTLIIFVRTGINPNVKNIYKIVNIILK